MNGRRIQLEWVLLDSCFVGFGARLAGLAPVWRVWRPFGGFGARKTAIRWRAATRALDLVRSSAHP